MMAGAKYCSIKPRLSSDSIHTYMSSEKKFRPKQVEVV